MIMAPGVRWTSDRLAAGDTAVQDRPRLLLVCDYRPFEAATVLDHIEAIRRWSRYDVFVLPNFGDLPDELDLAAFDGLVVHYNVVMSNPEYLSPLARWRISQFDGVKGAFIQDEYRFVNRTTRALRTLGINVLFTCVPEDQVHLVYPAERLPDMRRSVTVLTGYVPEPLLSQPIRPYHERVVDVSYRGRRLPAWMGRLAQEKSAIADRFAADAPAHGLAVDISCREEDRLYGQAWVDFLSRSKAMLGVESGAGVFDFDGSIEPTVNQYVADHPDASFEEVDHRFLTDVDGRIRLNQISPRCFEAAALGTLMVLYPGDYSGVLEPWRHYVLLEKDHSNMDEVVRAIRDPETWERITKQAREEVALNPKYGFRAMVEAVDDGLDLKVTPREPIGVAAFSRIASRSFARMPMTQRHAFGLPPAINRLRLLPLRAVRVLRPSPLAMSVSGIPPATAKQRLREVVGYLRALVYWGMRPRVLPLRLLLTQRGALLKELSELGRLQEFGARALATRSGSPLVTLIPGANGDVRIILASDAPADGRRLARLPDALPPDVGITLDLSDPMLIPLGVGQSQPRRLEALSAVMRARPDVGRTLLAGRTAWSSIVGVPLSMKGAQTQVSQAGPLRPPVRNGA